MQFYVSCFVYFLSCASSTIEKHSVKFVHLPRRIIKIRAVSDSQQDLKVKQQAESRRSYTVDFKAKVIKTSGKLIEIADKFGISKGLVSKWMKNKEQICEAIKQACEDSKRKDSGGTAGCKLEHSVKTKNSHCHKCWLQVGREKVCSRFQSYAWEGLKGQSSMNCLQNAKVQKAVLWEQ